MSPKRVRSQQAALQRKVSQQRTPPLTAITQVALSNRVQALQAENARENRHQLARFVPEKMFRQPGNLAGWRNANLCTLVHNPNLKT